MEMLYQQKLNQPQLDGVWQLLLRYGDTFVPPLSSRNSTCQQGLQPSVSASAQGPTAYFQELQKQQFLLSLEGERITGFLSFRRNFVPEILEKQREDGFLGLYVTTLIVDANFRRQGVARSFYGRLLTLWPRERRLISTRTWSGNTGHIALLETLGFAGPIRIPDDRGPGLDTVYYYKLLGEDAT